MRGFKNFSSKKIKKSFRNGQEKVANRRRLYKTLAQTSRHLHYKFMVF